MFHSINISLGELKVGDTQTIYFSYENILKILKTTSPCDCSVPVDEPARQRIKVTYTPKDIPAHLVQKKQYWYTVKKIITVEYKTKDEPDVTKTILLSFAAKISR